MMGFDDLFESYETEDEALEQIIKWKTGIL
jgi:hypothetical protein